MVFNACENGIFLVPHIISQKNQAYRNTKIEHQHPNLHLKFYKVTYCKQDQLEESKYGHQKNATNIVNSTSTSAK